MLAKVYVIRDPSGDPYRSTEYISGDREYIDKKLMLLKVRGVLAGYHIYPYENKSEYLKKTSLQWSKDVITEWFDRSALVEHYRPFRAFPFSR